jgi:hypothetical protein
MIMRLQHQRPDGEVDTYHLKPGRRYHIGRGSACEVRILDLKLSRKHCAVEFADGGWQIVDLLSTNGCKLDGEQIVGTVPLAQGAQIEAGQTVLTVAELVGGAAVDAGEGRIAEDADDSDHTETTRPEVVQEALPEDGTGRAESEKQDDDSNAWEPEPGHDPLNKTDALIPHAHAANKPKPIAPGLIKTPAPAQPAAPAQPEPSRTGSGQVRRPAAEPRRPTAVFRSEDLRVDDQDGEKTQLHTPSSPSPALESLPSAPAEEPARPATDAVPAGDRTFFITVLGRRVGPLTRAAARELKARELKGNLTTADLEGYPLG